MPFHLRLKRPLRPDGPADPDDVLNAKRGLKSFGFYDPDYPVHEIPDASLFDGIRRFQERFGLQVDGVMNPGGETERALNRVLAGSPNPLLPDLPPALEIRGEVGNGLENDPADVAGAKRTLAALGHYPKRLATEPTGLIDRPLTEAIRTFQARHNLLQDGWMGPGGETELALRRELVGRIPNSGQTVSEGGLFASQEEEEEPEDDHTKACDHLFWNIDIPTCRAISLRRGKRAAARCFHSAAARYAACLAGTPINQLPPLDTWDF
jgi:peptidoglycan hydrolase-like protein with peptidoglycan-binding domain